MWVCGLTIIWIKFITIDLQNYFGISNSSSTAPSVSVIAARPHPPFIYSLYVWLIIGIHLKMFTMYQNFGNLFDWNSIDLKVEKFLMVSISMSKVLCFWWKWFISHCYVDLWVNDSFFCWLKFLWIFRICWNFKRVIFYCTHKYLKSKYLRLILIIRWFKI